MMPDNVIVLFHVFTCVTSADFLQPTTASQTNISLGTLATRESGDTCREQDWYVNAMIQNNYIEYKTSLDPCPICVSKSILTKLCWGHCCHQITRSGRIVPDKEYRHKLLQRAHQRHVRECLAQAIFHKVLEMEVRCVKEWKAVNEILTANLWFPSHDCWC